jgi:hypothetical protein
MFKFELGAKAKNKTTGAEGKITGRADYLNGQNCYFIEDGTEEWQEEDNVEVIAE